MKSWTFYMVATSFGFTLLRLLWVAVTGDFTWAKHVGDITAMTAFAGWLIAEWHLRKWRTKPPLAYLSETDEYPWFQITLVKPEGFSVELIVKDKWL